MNFLFDFILCFVLIFLIYLVVFSRKKGIETFKKGKQIIYFKNYLHAEINDKNIKKFAIMFSLTNSFIIAFVVSLVNLIDNFILKLLLGFVLLIPLIMFCYYILARFFRKNK